MINSINDNRFFKFSKSKLFYINKDIDNIFDVFSYLENLNIQKVTLKLK